MSDLRDRDKNIINNWYILALSSEIKPNKLYERTVYDKSYVLFRDKENIVHALLNRCLHRLTQLDQGEIKDDCVICPYHGWVYAKDGKVTDIPSLGPDEKVPDMKLDVLTCYEQDGVIWGWMGEGSPDPVTPPWRFPYANDPSWVSYFMITDFQNEVTNLCENFMDVPHTVFVHKGWFRNQAQKKVPMLVETKNAKVLVTYKQENDKIGGMFHWLLNPKNNPMKHTDEFIYPNITRVDYTFGEDYGFIINSQNTPVSTLKSRTYTYIAYKIAVGSKLVKPFIQFYTRQVIEQDVDIMRIQSRSLELDPRENFRSTHADAVHIAIERIRQYGRSNNKLLHDYTNSEEKDFWI
jgi:phenylpropionate dioxygenase-like ring-hydroxylating dioxygenase large terminal subunit